MLMDLKTLQWDDEIAGVMGVPSSMLPEIRASSEVYGDVKAGGALEGVAIAGDLGDQQAATFGQTCFAVGEAKNTYGTGNFLLLNTGTEAVPSKSGLLTTVGYKIGDEDAVYCLEGSIAITGALVQWLRDNLKMIQAAPEVEELAKSVDDNGGCYIVPAFSGLFAPYWKSNARGVIAGLTRYVNAGHHPQFVLRVDGGIVGLPSTGMPIGLLPGQGYVEQQIALNEGDLLFFYTDGAVETENEAGDMFGAERLEALLLEAHNDGVDAVLERAESAVRSFRGNAEPFDDATMMALRVGR